MATPKQIIITIAPDGTTFTIVGATKTEMLGAAELLKHLALDNIQRKEVEAPAANYARHIDASIHIMD